MDWVFSKKKNSDYAQIMSIIYCWSSYVEFEHFLEHQKQPIIFLVSFKSFDFDGEGVICLYW